MGDRHLRSGETRAASECLECREVLTGVTHVGEAHVNELPQLIGGVSVCAYCGAIAIFADNDGRLRKPTEAEMAKIQQQPDIMEIVGIMKTIVQQKGGKG